jgi:hypothetical protein
VSFFMNPRPPHLRITMFHLLAAAVATIFSVSFGAHAEAKAPPHATTVFNAEAYGAPEISTDIVAVIPAGTELELSGDAAPGFLAVYYDGETLWVPSNYLTLGEQPWIETAVAVEDAPLRAAPLPDGPVLVVVPGGSTVVLTGAQVGGYDAAAHDGVGGWIEERDIAR